MSVIFPSGFFSAALAMGEHVADGKSAKEFLAIGEVRYAEAWPGSGKLPGGRTVFPRDHPSFPLPREGEGTEGERGIPPPGVRGNNHALAACGDTAQSNPLPNWSPHMSYGDRGEQKPSEAGAQRPTNSGPIRGRHERREVFRTPGVTSARPRPAQGGGSGPKAVCVADRNVVERVSTRSPGWRCA